MKTGRVHIYYGKGKGKTTSALGLVLRSLGWKKKIAVFFFLKPSPTGEKRFLAQISDIKIYSYNQIHPIFWRKNQERKEWRKLLSEVKKALNDLDIVLTQKYDLIVLDEILNLLDLGLITRDYLIKIIKSRLPRTEIVLTGRKCPRFLKKYADYITEMKFVKNPYYSGIKARRGIEY
ncbi:MAG TPA: cob(I)yrinic acid a,c-diamide adenosyltransferase [Candidatus Omnitrophica bacterium]|nr:cob(I)yrinic acid a,c-diamide adenosyltransferase [Candidatus Omnitrophota bacterium]